MTREALLQAAIEVFVPLFVAMTPLSAVSMFLSLTEGYAPDKTRSLARRALVTALIVALAVVFVGQALFRVLGITLDDLRVGGGLILLAIAVHDLMFTRERRDRQEIEDDADLGAVPIGTPLIVGPATMTTCVVLADSHGHWVVVGALLANLLLVAVMLLNADAARRALHPAVSKAFGKVMSLFLAGIAVAMLRVGVTGMLRALP